MSKTALQLIRELGKRVNGMVLSTATSNGTATTVVDTGLRKHFPVDGGADKWVPWVYCTSDADSGTNDDAANYEQRAKQWTQSTATILLYSPGFPNATATGDVFEVHSSVRRERLLEAINDAVRRLGLYWYREFVDTSTTTTASTWRYTLPASANWAAVHRVEIQATTDSDLATYPYEPATGYNWRAYKDVSTAGAEVWYLQFSVQPPTGRVVRVWGEGYFSELTTDASVLAISGAWEGPALAWILEWAKFRIEDEIAERSYFGETDKVRQKAIDSLNRSLEKLKSEAPPHKPKPISIPGVGTGQLPGEKSRDSGWLGLLRSSIDHAPS